MKWKATTFIIILMVHISASSMLPLLPFPASVITIQCDTNWPWMDYKSFDLPTIDPRLFGNACVWEANCKASVYTHPVERDLKACCCQKSGSPRGVENTCFELATKLSPQSHNPFGFRFKNQEGRLAMKLMNISLMIAFLSAIGLLAQAGKSEIRTFVIDGENITCQVIILDPPLVIKREETNLNQANVINCSYLFYSLLAKGDIAGASKLSNAPGKVKEKFTRQKERVGEADFKKMFAGYFSGGTTLKYVFAIGKSYMLVVHNDEMNIDMAQFYSVEGNNFVVDEKESNEKDQLGKLFMALKGEDENVRLK